jgi:hypothetical protein
MRGASGVAPEKGFSAPLIEHMTGIEEAHNRNFRSTHTNFSYHRL